MAGFVHACRWFDVMQKVSNQLRSSITNVTRHRGDKVKQLIDYKIILNLSLSWLSLSNCMRFLN